MALADGQGNYGARAVPLRLATLARDSPSRRCARVTPELSFHAQPFDAGHEAGALLRARLEDEALDSVIIVVAWARFRGVRRLKDAFDAFRARGGQVRI